MDMNNQDAGNTELIEQIEIGQALQRLEQNPDYKLVIGQAYIMDTLVDRSIDMLDIQPPIRQEAMEAVMAVTYFRKRLTELKMNAVSAVEALNMSEEE